MIILRDDKYSRDPQIFDCYEDMTAAVRAVCALNGWEFTEQDEEALVYTED